MTFRTIRWEPCVPLLAAVLGGCMAGACDRGDPPPQAPSTAPSTTPVRVRGTEKVLWDQAAYDATRLERYRYIVYIDDVPVDLAGVTCGPTTNNATFPCGARLPPLTPGSHRLQLAVEEIDGKQRHSSKSGALLLEVLPPGKSP